MISSQICSQCNQAILILSEQSASNFCPLCLKYFDIMDFQLQNKFVPTNYDPNLQSAIINSKMRNSLKYMNQFTQKFSINSKSEVEMLVNQVYQYIQNAQIKKCSSYKQLCAAIFYHNYRHQFKLNLRQFCKEFQLQTKKFNRTLLGYGSFKNQQKPQLEKQQEQNIEQTQNSDQIIQKCKNFLKLIANQLFSFLISSPKKIDLILEGVIGKINTNNFEQVSNKQKISLLLLKALKELKHPITYKRYEQLCKRNGMKFSKSKFILPKQNRALSTQTDLKISDNSSQILQLSNL